MKILIENTTIVNEGREFAGSVLIAGELIAGIYEGIAPEVVRQEASRIIDGAGKLLMPGIIDSHVHFREPGLTHKGDFRSESRAALAGGVTSFMDMPNTVPQTVSNELWAQKAELAAQHSLANYAFYLGATNDNLSEVLKADPAKVCGIKLFMGSSTGNMLVDKRRTLERLFAESPLLIATHCEDEALIRANAERYKNQLGESLPMSYHPLIRSEEACYRSTAEAVELAERRNARLHVLHLSTARELSLFSNAPLGQKHITAETCPHYLWFTADDYAQLGSRLKCNPAVKEQSNRAALRQALAEGKIDAIATDHAPHTRDEKQGSYFQALSGMPQVQHSFATMLELVSPVAAVEKMCHAPALLFDIDRRGFIREGYFADLALIDPHKTWTVDETNILSRCGWSPYEGITFRSQVTHTFVNGKLAYENGVFDEDCRGKALVFSR